MFDIQEIAQHFQLPGSFRSAVPLVKGHINDTFVATFVEGAREIRYIIQHVNQGVFHDPPALMDNVVRVTSHQRKKLMEAGVQDVDRRVLTLVPAKAGGFWHVDGRGNTWRAYVFIEKASTFEVIHDPGVAFQAARAFGTFQKQLVDLPGGRLHDTIPDFHNTPKRFEALEKAIAADRANRASQLKPEIEFALRHRDHVRVLTDHQAAGRIPERNTHNDTKVNNVMLDDTTGEGICVIDLDTVMPGLVLYDFGDLVRSATNSAREDEQDLARVEMQMPVFEAIARGYLETAGDFLNRAEREHLAFSGLLISFEVGIRFLTDYLEGDVYFKTHRPGHNLDRCRVHFKLSDSMLSRQDEMNRFVASLG